MQPRPDEMDARLDSAAATRRANVDLSALDRMLVTDDPGAAAGPADPPATPPAARAAVTPDSKAAASPGAKSPVFSAGSLRWPRGWAAGLALLVLAQGGVIAALLVRPAPGVVAPVQAAGDPPATVAAAPPAIAPGAVEVGSDPAGALVSVDGEAVGKTPLTLADLEPGEHDVVLASGARQWTRTITVEPGRLTQLAVVFLSAAPAPAPPLASRQGSGWMSIASPIELTVMEDGRVVGTTRSDRIMMPAGRHVLTLTSERFGVNQRHAVEIKDGSTVALTAQLPDGTVSVNALPWAEVWIGDRKVGNTPLANLAVPVGVHEVVFRHPTLGERRDRLTVTADAPARLSVDMKR